MLKRANVRAQAEDVKVLELSACLEQLLHLLLSEGHVELRTTRSRRHNSRYMRRREVMAVAGCLSECMDT